MYTGLPATRASVFVGKKRPGPSPKRNVPCIVGDQFGVVYTAPPVQPQRVLVVDPSNELIDSISAHLGADGFDVQQAVDGESALSIFTSAPPDLVVLDLQLSKLPGLDVLPEIRRVS